MANDFSGDSSCLALWNFESGALLTDSKGTNTLTASASAPTADTTNYKQGSASAKYTKASSQNHYITDANLASGFPFKSGDTTKLGTFCFWIRFNAVNESPSIIGKWKTAAGTTKYCINLSVIAGILNVYWGTSDSAYETLGTITPSTGIWYHVTVTFDGINKKTTVLIWNDSTQASVAYNKTWTGALNVSTGDFFISGNGATYYLDGDIDELVVFNRILNFKEAAQVRMGKFPSTNSYANDASLKAEYRLESGALTTDSKSTNTLTNNNTVGEATTAGLFQEGACAGQFDAASHRYLSLADAGKSADFPLRAADTRKIVSYAGWVRPTSVAAGWKIIFGTTKYSTTNRMGVGLSLNGAALMVHVGSGAASGSNDTTVGKNLVANQWYHIGLAYDGNNGNVHLRIWDETAGTATTYDLTSAVVLGVGTDDFRIGAYVDQNANYTFDGQIDEVLVFNRQVSDAEFDAIRTGTYANTLTEPRIEGTAVFAQVEYEETPLIIADGVLAQVEYDPIVTIPPLDVSGDTSCKAFWRFESGALGADSKGGNTLTGGGTAFDLAKEGASSLYLAGATGVDYLKIVEGSLDAGFPLKTGDVTQLFTLSFWWQRWNAATNRYLFFKGSTNALYLYHNSSNHLIVGWPYATGTETYDTGLIIGDKVWYHTTLGIDGPNKRAFVLHYNSSTGVVSYLNKTWTNALALGGDLYLGSNSTPAFSHLGLMDEALVFNRLLTWWDVLRIIGRTYDKARGTNDFSGVSALKAQWFFDTSGITTDSSGNNNTITDPGSTHYPIPYAPEGDQSVHITGYGGAFYPTITDANLCSGFPLKNGDTARLLSYCVFCMPFTTVGGEINNGFLMGKGDSGVSYKNLTGLYLVGTGEGLGKCTIRVYWGDGVTNPYYDTGITLYTGRQYHIALVIDGVNKTIYVRVYDPYLNQIYTYSGSPSTALVTNNSRNFGLGISSSVCSAMVDEALVFNSLLTPSDIDYIRKGIYVPPQTYNLTTAIAGVSATGSPILALARTFITSILGVSASSSAILAVLRALATTIAGASATSEPVLDIEEGGPGGTTYDLTTSILGESATSEPILAVLRKMTASILGVSDTSAPLLAVLRKLISDIEAESAVGSPVLRLTRDLATSVWAVSGTSTPILRVVRDLTTAIQAGTSLSEPWLILTLATLIRAVSATSSPVLGVYRELVTRIAAGTLTPDFVLGIIRDLETEIQGIVSITDPELQIWPSLEFYLRNLEIVLFDLNDLIPIEIPDDRTVVLDLDDGPFHLAVGEE